MGQILLQIIKGFSYLPKSFFKVLSNFLAFILNHIIRYRGDVILRNLKRSFPGKSKQEIKVIKQGFYLNLADVFTEIIYTLSLPKEKVMKKFRVFNDKVIYNLYQDHNNIIVVASHNCNLEIGLSVLPLFVEHNVYVIYKPLKNKTSEFIINSIRQRFGVKLITKKESAKFILSNKDQKKLIVFISDQTPYPENAIWTEFLNQQTPIFGGAEVMAKKLNSPVVFAYNRRQKRGKYELGFELLTENPKALAPEEITNLHVKYLEQEIIKAPSNWLWSHKRWKHKPPKKELVN